MWLFHLETIPRSVGNHCIIKMTLMDQGNPQVVCVSGPDTSQVDLRFCLSHIQHCWKSHVAAKIFNELINNINMIRGPI